MQKKLVLYTILVAGALFSLRGFAESSAANTTASSKKTSTQAAVKQEKFWTTAALESKAKDCTHLEGKALHHCLLNGLIG